MVTVVLAVSAACRSGVETPNTAAGSTAGPATHDAPIAASAATPAATPTSSQPRVVFLGDSLTAGLGLDQAEAYPALVQRRLKDRGLAFDVVNAGVSGDTSAGGLSRLDWALEGNVKVLVLALGANDGLRGLPIEELGRNLSAIIERAQSRHVTVVLAGMEAPPNFGMEYTTAFHSLYPTLARKYHVRLVPFLLDKVAGIQSLNQRDGIHPNAQGAAIVADNVCAVLEPVLEGLPTGD